MKTPDEAPKLKIHIDTSLAGVVRQSAVSFTSDFFSAHPENLIQLVERRKGIPLDISGNKMLTEAQLVLDGFTAGVANMLHAIITGKLDIAVIKKKIQG